jgi:hypothetical protein
MVHSWVHLRNNKIIYNCLNNKVKNIFINNGTYFYGDYDLDIYLGTKSDYNNLQSVVKKVFEYKLKQCFKIRDERIGDYTDIKYIINEFGNVESTKIKRFLPRKETYKVIKSIIYRYDGNVKVIACETERYYYLFCFITS